MLHGLTPLPGFALFGCLASELDIFHELGWRVSDKPVALAVPRDLLVNGAVFADCPEQPVAVYGQAVRSKIHVAKAIEQGYGLLGILGNLVVHDSTGFGRSWRFGRLGITRYSAIQALSLRTKSQLWGGLFGSI